MEISDIEKVLIVIELKSGSAHQVLASKENKKLVIQMIGQLEGKILLDKSLVPFTLETREIR